MTKPLDTARTNNAKTAVRASLLLILIAVFLIGIIIVLVFAFIPGMLAPRRLGVEPTQIAYNSALQKLRLSKDVVTQEHKGEYVLEYGDAQQVVTVLSAEELTSLLSMNIPADSIIKDAQIVIDGDGIVEFSGSVDAARLSDRIGVLGEELKRARKMIPFGVLLTNSVSVYANFEANIINNKIISLDIRKLELIGVDVTEDINAFVTMSEIINEINAQLQTLHERSGAFVDELRMSSGSVFFKGMMPETITHRKL